MPKEPRESGELRPVDRTDDSTDTRRTYADLELLAQQYLRDNGEGRIAFFRDKFGPEIGEAELRDYLLNSVPEPEAFPPEAVTEIVWYNRNKGTVLDKADQDFLFYSSSDPRFAEMIDLNMQIGTTRFHFQNHVSELRMQALMIEHGIQTDPVEFMRRNFVETLVINVVEDGGAVPPALELLMDRHRLERIKAKQKQLDEREREKADEYHAAAEDYLKSVRDSSRNSALQAGSHPRFAEKRSDEEAGSLDRFLADVEEGRRSRLEEIAEFLAKHPDPRIFIDQLLDAKDGKLPI